MSSRNEQTIRHEPSDECFVDEFHRRCPKCGVSKELFHFRPESDKPIPQFEITPYCNVCRGDITRHLSEEQRDLKRTAALSANTQAIQSLGEMLNNVGKRRVIEEACPSLVDGVRLIVEQLGGETEFWKLTATALREVINSPKPSIKIKGVNAAIGLVRDGNKAQGEPIDFGNVSDDELIVLLREPARALLLSDADFRAELLNDPEVRRMFQSDLGIEVLETEGVIG